MILRGCRSRQRLPRQIIRYFHCSSKDEAVTRIADVLAKPPGDGVEITVQGHVQSIRRQKARCFAAISDGSSLQTLQAIISPENSQKWALIHCIHELH